MARIRTIKADPERDGYELMAKLASLPVSEVSETIECADDLMRALVRHSDNKGRYYAHIFLLRRLCWESEVKDSDLMLWRSELVDRGEIAIKPIGRSIFTGKPQDIIVICRRRRFDRFAPRSPIPSALREMVFDRDGYRCVWCDSEEDIELDHIVPFSRGGSDSESNLQTLCRSCNRSKGNNDNEVARLRVMGGGR